MTVFTGIEKSHITKLRKLGFTATKIASGYELARLKGKDTALVLYASGKLLVQGKPEAVKAVAAKISKLKMGKEQKSVRFRPTKGTLIGSDECLKGDTFGGIVVAAVKADDAARRKLIELGVADSKTLDDEEIEALAEKIKQTTSCEIKSLLPAEYNHWRDSVTVLLNKLHTECASFLKPGTHVVDKYPGCLAGDMCEEKAESKYVEVAAASILARAAALKQFDYLSHLAGFTIPKGSTHVENGLQQLKEKGLDFRQFVKLHFQNVSIFVKKQ